ncbi:MAG TPA: LamG-like jellyroll fold domain-containing protein [Planctomycetota bacterium]|nr:LamG-like jellyroll fold domain-containing protein [Planctomycetota bacterium]
MDMGRKLARSGWTLAFVALLGASAAQAQETGSGLVGYWKLDDTGSPAQDSALTNNLTWSGTPAPSTDIPAAITFPDPHSLSFNGSTDFANIAALTGLAAGNTPHSIAAWVKVKALPANRAWILLLGSPTNGAHHWLINSSGGTQFGVWGGGQVQPALTVGVWQHVAMTFDGTTLSGYLNGAPLASNPTAAATYNLQGIPFEIAQAQIGENDFNGLLDDVRLYDRPLTAAEVQALAAGGEGPGAPTNLVATPGNGQVSLSWTAPVGGATVYNVKRSTVSGGPYTTIASNVTGTTYLDTAGITNGTRYYYVVSGVTYGEGPNSNEASCVPGLVGPTPATLSVSERGGLTSFLVTAFGPPVAGMFQVTVQSGNPQQALVSTSGAPAASVVLTFSTGGSASQQVFVTGVDDMIAGDPQTVTLSLGTIQNSTDANYPSGYAISSVSVSVLEADMPGILISPVSGPVVDGGGPVTFTVALNSKPVVTTSPVTAGTVVLDVSNSASQVSTVSPPQLSFNDTNWNLPQTVTITPLNDNGQSPSVFFAVQTVVITLSPDPATTDPAYAALSPASAAAPFIDPYPPPALPQVWGGSKGCGLLGLELGIPLLLAIARRRRRRPS